MSTADESLTRQGTATPEAYDHTIRLIDTTAPKGLSEEDNDALARLDTRDPRWRDLARRVPTRTSVREGLARKKWAKWQEGRESFESQGQAAEGAVVPAPESGSKSGSITPQKSSTVPHANIQGTDFAGTVTETRGRSQEPAEASNNAGLASPIPKSRKKKHRKEEYEIDILYENQRGMFFAGIPLYSHNSLLNFDPAPWVTKSFKDSSVNITNAQLPDPTWEWEWKSWYVDMSYDVDEEGWQYSFAFSPKYSWHGTHPWFHSFVRRRRWLRKRVKCKHAVGDPAQSSTMSQAHVLTADYFTIHPKAARSRDTSNDRGTTGRESYGPSITASIREAGVAAEDIRDIPTLMRALKSATIDREKIDAVRAFVSQGGEELLYLKDSIPAIMSYLVFQNSRRQLLVFLKDTADNVSRHRQEHHLEKDNPEGEEEQRRIDNLLAAVQAAGKQIDGLEYWSDRKHVLQTSDENGERRPETAISKDSNQIRKGNPMEDDVIKGIPNGADVGIDPTKDLLKQTRATEEGVDDEVPEKGKEKVDESQADDNPNKEEEKVDEEQAENSNANRQAEADLEEAGTEEEASKAEDGRDDEEESLSQLPVDAMRIG